MSSSFWRKSKNYDFRAVSFQEAIGVVIDSLPVGEEIDLEAVRKFMERRARQKCLFYTP